jgi:hypothetical protein
MARREVHLRLDEGVYEALVARATPLRLSVPRLVSHLITASLVNAAPSIEEVAPPRSQARGLRPDASASRPLPLDAPPREPATAESRPWATEVAIERRQPNRAQRRAQARAKPGRHP